MSRPDGSRRMKRHCVALISILLFAVIARSASTQESENAIRAHIEGLHSDRGQVVCALFAAANDFPKRIAGGRFRKFRNRRKEWTDKRSDAKRAMCEAVSLSCAIQMTSATIFAFGGFDGRVEPVGRYRVICRSGLRLRASKCEQSDDDEPMVHFTRVS